METHIFDLKTTQNIKEASSTRRDVSNSRELFKCRQLLCYLEIWIGRIAEVVAIPGHPQPKLDQLVAICHQGFGPEMDGDRMCLLERQLGVLSTMAPIHLFLDVARREVGDPHGRQTCLARSAVGSSPFPLHSVGLKRNR
jgi:hypothetical protein